MYTTTRIVRVFIAVSFWCCCGYLENMWRERERKREIATNALNSKSHFYVAAVKTTTITLYSLSLSLLLFCSCTVCVYTLKKYSINSVLEKPKKKRKKNFIFQLFLLFISALLIFQPSFSLYTFVVVSSLTNLSLSLSVGVSSSIISHTTKTKIIYSSASLSSPSSSCFFFALTTVRSIFKKTTQKIVWCTSLTRPAYWTKSALLRKRTEKKRGFISFFLGASERARLTPTHSNDKQKKNFWERDIKIKIKKKKKCNKKKRSSLSVFFFLLLLHTNTLQKCVFYLFCCFNVWQAHSRTH